MLATFISGGAHFVFNRAWALLHKLDRSELLTGTQLRDPDDSWLVGRSMESLYSYAGGDSVEGQLWERKRGHAGTKSSARIRTHHEARDYFVPSPSGGKELQHL
jgi:hypothetical protein